MGKRSISSPASTNSSTQEKKDAMKMNCLSPVQESTLCKLVTLSQDMASRRGFSTLELLLPFLSLSLALSFAKATDRGSSRARAQTAHCCGGETGRLRKLNQSFRFRKVEKANLLSTKAAD